MNKILYNLHGQQFLEECVGVTSDATILWNEQVHGLIPSIILGSMEAFDEMDDVLNPDGSIQYLPEVDADGKSVLDSEGKVVLSANPRQELVHKLRVLSSEIPTHTAAIAALNQVQINNEARTYLASTDWMILREADSGILCPVEIKAARAAARLRII